MAHRPKPHHKPEHFAALSCPTSVTWTNDIQGMFTAAENACMKPRGIDLSSYASVRQHALSIYSEVESGDMPLGGPRWSSDMVNTFGCWIQQGYPQ